MSMSRTLSRWLIVVLLAAFVLSSAYFLVLLFSQEAEAQGGRSLRRGYFTNQLTSQTSLTNSNDVIVGGINMETAWSQAQRKANFISQIESRLTGGSAQNRSGAAFVVQTMRGEPWGRNRPPTAAQIQDWKDRVNNNDIVLTVVSNQSYTINSGYFQDIADDAFINHPGERRSVLFRHRDTNASFYLLKLDCANPLGNLPGLPSASGPSTLQPQSLVNGSTTSPVNVSAADGTVSFLHRINVGSYNGRSHTVGYRVERFIASASASCPSGGTWTTVATGTVSVGSSTRNVWGTTTVTGWDRNTTLRICQRLVITSNGGASVSPTTAVAYANIMAGTITVGTSSGGYVEPGAPFNLTTFVNANADGGTSYSMTYNLSYTTNIPGLSPPGANSGTVTVSGATNRNNDWNGTVPASTPAGTEICMNAIVTQPTQVIYFTNGISQITECITVVAKPTVRVSGGDVSAGMGFESGGVCGGGSATAAVTGWPNEPTYNGAGTAFGVFALGRVIGFASAQVNSNGATPPRALAFANTPAGSGEDYGGSFGSLPCIADHYGASPSPVSSLPNLGVAALQNSSSGHFAFNAGIIPPNSPVTIPTGSQKIVYVDGDLRIGSNIIYAGRGGWSNVTDIPGIKFVVRGDIYIRNNVTQLDGIYVAQPRPGNANSGRIYTCVDNSWTPIARGTTSASSLFSTCNTQLTVNGTFSADRIEFLRASGTSASGQPAEQFNYLPELWQARWPADSSASGGLYDAITGLPPVL